MRIVSSVEMPIHCSTIGNDGARFLSIPASTRTWRRIYERTTRQIIAAIEAGTGPFRMPWHHDGSSTSRPVNVTSGKNYRGANTLLLWAAAESAGYSSGVWGTYRQWTTKGAQVRRGEHATTVIFWKPVRGADHADEGDDEEPARGRRFIARGYNVFNRCQVDNYEEPAVPTLDEGQRIARADAFFKQLGIAISYGGASAFYRVDHDQIFMPPFGAFIDPLAFYSVLFHEAGHATGAEHRLNRDLKKRFSTHAQAIEEVVAELTAAFILADLGLSCRPRDDHAAYVADWLEALKNDTRAIVTAASQAQAAADWMHAQRPGGKTLSNASAMGAA